MLPTTIFAASVAYAPSLSVVIPAFNERNRLPPTLEASVAYLRDADRDWELIVVDDGSTDDTVGWTRGWMARQTTAERLRVLRSETNCGKGDALAAGVRCAKGQRVLFMDADGGTPLSALPLLEQVLDSDSTCSIVVGKRQREETPRPVLRQIMGIVFAALTATCVTGVADTQCGFKLLTREAAASTMPHLRVRRWAYDVEALFLAQQLGLGVASADVPAVDVSGSKIRWHTPIEMLLDVLRVSLLYRVGVWALPRRGGAGGREAAGASFVELE